MASKKELSTLRQVPITEELVLGQIFFVLSNSGATPFQLTYRGRYRRHVSGFEESEEEYQHYKDVIKQYHRWGWIYIKQ